MKSGKNVYKCSISVTEVAIFGPICFSPGLVHCYTVKYYSNTGGQVQLPCISEYWPNSSTAVQGVSLPSVQSSVQCLQGLAPVPAVILNRNKWVKMIKE